MSKNRERKDQKEQRKCESHPSWLRRRSLLALAIVSAVPASARAQSAGLTRPGLGAKPPMAVAVAPITQDHVESFATAVGDEPYIVAQVLAYNPDLVPVAVAASEARDKRRRLSKGLIIGGFSVLGVGIVAGVLVALSAPLLCFDDPECQQKHDSASNTAAVMAIGGAAVGLALALPGFIANARESDIEVEAIRRYRGRRFEAAPPREPARFPAVGYAPRSVNLPVLSLTF